MASTSERIYVVRSGASGITSTPVALVAATAKTVVGCFGTAATTLGLKRIRGSFASVTATDVPATGRVGFTSPTGTVGTAFPPGQTVGSSVGSIASAGYNYSAEPPYVRIFET